MVIGVSLRSRLGRSAEGGSGLHADTISYRDRIIANGGTISSADLAAVDTFIKAAYTNGLRDISGSNHKILDCSPLAGDNLAAAQVKLWYPSGTSDKLTLVNFVVGDYSRTTGLDPGVAIPLNTPPQVSQKTGSLA